MFNRDLIARIEKLENRVFKKKSEDLYGFGWDLFSTMSIEEDLKDVNVRIKALEDLLKIKLSSVSEKQVYIKKGGK
jgi:hypothetical protein